MSIMTKRVLAAILALSAIFVGGWAAAAPRSFYRDFPFRGRQWVSMLGPYNEHLVRDVGGLYLALFVISAWVALRPAAPALRVTGLAWLVFGLEHLAYHVRHLAMFPVFDKITMTAALGGVVVLAALLTLPTPAAHVEPTATASSPGYE